MTFGEDWGWGANYEVSRKMFEAFAEAGGNFIDTANLYTNGTSEIYVGEFIAADRDKWVLATKYTLNTGQGEINAGGNHRKNMVQAVEASLQRLRVDYIDLLWLHAWDFTTPVEEVMRAFDDLVRAGKVLYIGVSDTPAWIVAQANTLATLRGWTPFIGLQIEYSLRERTPERELLPMAAALEVGVTAWSPLGGGVLTGKYNREKPTAGRLSSTDSLVGISERDLAIAEVVIQIAAQSDRAPAQVALNWLRQQPQTIIPILGGRQVEQIQQNLACLDFELTPAHMEQLDQVSTIELGFPHTFLQSEMVQDFAFGGALKLLDR
jgi:aryl-alcohol dehydrogenase-like predicted oxidoreductase